jgi:hypothetical protein
VDVTTIANMALSAIGTRSTIASLTEDSTEAQTCSLWFDQVRDGLLRSLPWNWARRQVVLAIYKSAAGTPENPQGALPEPPRPWRYEYSWPADCLDARYILPLANRTGGAITPPLTTSPDQMVRDQRTPPIKFLVAGDRDVDGNAVKVILTNQALAQLVYTGKITDANIWDANFVDAMIGRLAQCICFALSGDKGLTQIAVAGGVAAEARAEAANGDEGIAVNVWTPDWLEARGYIDSTNDDSDCYAGMSPQDIS